MNDITTRSIYPAKFRQVEENFPSRIVILEIDFKKKCFSKDIIIEFLRGSLHDNVDEPYELFEQVASGNKELFNKIKYGSGSGRRLAADGECLTCFVIRLSDNVNWQFMRKHDPMMGYENCDLNQFATNPNRIGKNGRPINANTEFDGCKTAYFIVDGSACREYTKTRNIESNGHYNLPFNINVELFYTANRMKHYLPIIIDPEVIWPGGTKPPQFYH